MEIVLGLGILTILYFLLSLVVNGIAFNYLKNKKNIDIKNIDENVLIGRFLFWPIYVFTRIVKLLRYMMYYAFVGFCEVITDWK